MSDSRTARAGPGKGFFKATLISFNFAFDGSMIHAAKHAPPDTFPPFVPQYVVDALWAFEYVAWVGAGTLAVLAAICLIGSVIETWNEEPAV